MNPLILALLLLSPPQLIDRVLAVVGGQPILLSDVTAARRFGLVRTEGEDDPVRAVLDALIDRQLKLAEVNRYLPAEPAEGDVDQALAAVRQRFANEAAFAQALRETGLSVEQLRTRLRDDLRVVSYLDSRFGGTLQPSEDQVQAYYRAHDTEFRRSGVLPPFAEVRAEARARLVAEQRASVERDWLAGLRRRAEISDLYLTKQ